MEERAQREPARHLPDDTIEPAPKPQDVSGSASVTSEPAGAGNLRQAAVILAASAALASVGIAAGLWFGSTVIAHPSLARSPVRARSVVPSPPEEASVQVRTLSGPETVTQRDEAFRRTAQAPDRAVAPSPARLSSPAPERVVPAPPQARRPLLLRSAARPPASLKPLPTSGTATRQTARRLALRPPQIAPESAPSDPPTPASPAFPPAEESTAVATEKTDSAPRVIAPPSSPTARSENPPRGQAVDRSEPSHRASTEGAPADTDAAKASTIPLDPAQLRTQAERDAAWALLRRRARRRFRQSQPPSE